HAAALVEPVGEHARDQPEVRHAVHDDSAEVGAAEVALHVAVVEVQRVVVEGGVAEGADRLAGHREARPLDRLPDLDGFEGVFHGRPQSGRMVWPRPAQITCPRWLKNTLSWT